MSRIFYSDLRLLYLGTDVIMNRLSATVLIVLLFLQKAGLFFTFTQLEKDNSVRFAVILTFYPGHISKRISLAFEYFLCRCFQESVFDLLLRSLFPH